MGDVRGYAGAVTGTVLVDTNVFTTRLRERSPLATRYAKCLFGQRIALAPQTAGKPGQVRLGGHAARGAQVGRESGQPLAFARALPHR
jgi:hypothetical protein